MISVFNGLNAINTCVARPKRVESCRGDAPAAAFFDEAAFMEEDFFNRFARPLLMVRYTKTPPFTAANLKLKGQRKTLHARHDSPDVADVVVCSVCQTNH